MAFDSTDSQKGETVELTTAIGGRMQGLEKIERPPRGQSHWHVSRERRDRRHVVRRSSM